MAKKKTATKKSGNKTTNKKINKTKTSDSRRLIAIEKRLIRIEKLVMLSLDPTILAEREKARIKEIEKMVRDGNIDELSELN